jgi:hypothetical protein
MTSPYRVHVPSQHTTLLGSHTPMVTWHHVYPSKTVLHSLLVMHVAQASALALNPPRPNTTLEHSSNIVCNNRPEVRLIILISTPPLIKVSYYPITKIPSFLWVQNVTSILFLHKIEGQYAGQCLGSAAHNRGRSERPLLNGFGDYRPDGG